MSCYNGLSAQGLAPFGKMEGETETRGLAGLAERCARYRQAGARFAKWRAALRIAGEHGPSDAAVQRNAEQLAEYAAVCQARGPPPAPPPPPPPRRTSTGGEPAGAPWLGLLQQ